VRPEGLGKLKKTPHRVPKPQPSGLKLSALTITLTRSPHNVCIIPSNYPIRYPVGTATDATSYSLLNTEQTRVFSHFSF
jgi:hypothetical protein